MAEYEVTTVRRYRLTVEASSEQQARKVGIGFLDMEQPAEEFVESVRRLG